MCSVIKTDGKLYTIVDVAVGQLTAQLQAEGTTTPPTVRNCLPVEI
jgi:hypothetical protein